MRDDQPNSVPACGDPRACAVLDAPSAAVIVNADDWGRDVLTTDRTLECVRGGSVSSVSAMVFMEDSERAAALARLHGVDAGLHLNFTLPFTSSSCPVRLLQHQEKLARFLKPYWRASMVYNLGLASSFEYVAKAQMEEYQRIFGTPAARMDGHHHMHLSANVLAQKLIPEGIIVRRNFSFGPGEKGFLNRMFRRRQDRMLARRHRVTDFFFDLLPIEPESRLRKILALADRFNVEIETHPARDEEYDFLMKGGLKRFADGVAVSQGYALRIFRTDSGIAGLTCAQQAWR